MTFWTVIIWPRVLCIFAFSSFFIRFLEFASIIAHCRSLWFRHITQLLATISLHFVTACTQHNVHTIDCLGFFSFCWVECAFPFHYQPRSFLRLSGFPSRVPASSTLNCRDKVDWEAAQWPVSLGRALNCWVKKTGRTGKSSGELPPTWFFCEWLLLGSRSPSSSWFSFSNSQQFALPLEFCMITQSASHLAILSSLT